MRGPRTISGVGLAPTAVGFWLHSLLTPLSLSLIGCQASRAQPERPTISRSEIGKRLTPAAASPAALESAAVSATTTSVASAKAVPSAIAHALQELHEQRLDLPPPITAPQELEFGPGSLLEASSERVLLRETQRGELLSEARMETVLALAHGSDGALFALGVSGGVRFEAHAKQARAFPRSAFFPGSTLFPDLENPSQFYVYYPSEQELLRYPFETDASAFLTIEARVPLPGCLSAPTELRDGALACRTATGFARKAPRGTRSDFTPTVDLGWPFRLLPARRLDELYSVDRAGEVKHLRLVAGVPVLAAFRLPALPFAAAANPEALAFVLVSPPEPGKERRWSVVVLDPDGQIRMQAELDSQAASADEDWARAITLDKNLAISGYEPLVAVGGAGHVKVWDYDAGTLRFER